LWWLEWELAVLVLRSQLDRLLEARVLAVADVVEAMSSHRPYRPARGIDKALEEVSQNRGILYDPAVVDTCLKLFAEERFEFESPEAR
jgi:HD-GYP domain-containing protein (c-di-GMP phosphodiesterase class II)